MTPIYDPKTYEVRRSVAYLMSRVRMALHDTMDQELDPHAITTAQWVVILLLANGVASTSSEICHVMTCDPGAMTRMIDRLERKGFVRRVRSPADRRSVKLELTPEGKAVYPKILAVAIGVLNRFLRGFTKKEVRQMEEFLNRMLANG